jgi:long-chain acyl-CoA synthetase
MMRPWLKHIAEGNPQEIDIPDMTLYDMLHQSVEMYADHTAITFLDKTLTYRQLHQYVLKAAASFHHELGIKKGDRVALMLPNCPQYVISYFAVTYLGGIVVQTNPLYTEQELQHQLTDSGTKMIICVDLVYPKVQNVLTQTPLEKIIVTSIKDFLPFPKNILYPFVQKLPKVEYQKETISWKGLLKGSNSTPKQASIDPKEDVAVLQYTGGTTGRSKGAMLTHYNLVANTLQSVATSQKQTDYGAERVLTISPLFHVYGMTSGMNITLHIGGNLILLPRFDVDEMIKTINKTKPTAFPGVPTMYIALMNHPKAKEVDMSSFKTCTSGSAPLPVEILEGFNRSTGASIGEGYGLSEASPVTHRNPIGGLQKPGSIGIPIPNTDAKVVGLDTDDEEVATGEVGELIIKGPQIMKGYWNMPEETNRTIRDGWLYTGDLAKVDEHGFFYIVGRKKELIIASGYKVYPVEVEEVIYTHPHVMEAAIIGVPDAYRGETVKAVIALKEGTALTEEELIAYCKERLAAYKVPKIVEFRSELPKTVIGKILKRKLKEEDQKEKVAQ